MRPKEYEGRLAEDRRHGRKATTVHAARVSFSRGRLHGLRHLTDELAQRPAPGGAQHCRCLVTAQPDYTLPSVVPDVARIGIDHGEEAADALPVLLH